MPCVNCRRIYNETGIKTPHWWFGNRASCCFPGGGRELMLGRCVCVIPNDILSDIFPDSSGINNPISSVEINDKWASMSNEQRISCLQVLIMVWAGKISERINTRHNSANASTPTEQSTPHYIAYQAANRFRERSEQTNVMDSYVTRVQQSIIRYFKHAHSDDSADHIRRHRLERERNRLLAQRRSLTQNISRPPSIQSSSVKLLTAATTSSTVHESSECPVCLNEFKSECGTIITTCGHKLCIGCFANIIIKNTKNKINCPICRSVILS
jgi:hypothetical protein